MSDWVTDDVFGRALDSMNQAVAGAEEAVSQAVQATGSNFARELAMRARRDGLRSELAEGVQLLPGGRVGLPESAGAEEAAEAEWGGLTSPPRATLRRTVRRSHDFNSRMLSGQITQNLLGDRGEL